MDKDLLKTMLVPLHKIYKKIQEINLLSFNTKAEINKFDKEFEKENKII